MEFAGDFAYYGEGYQAPGAPKSQWRIDPNCLAVRLNTLHDTEVLQIPYTPPSCCGCDALFCSTSELSRSGWKCEYCGMTTEISAEEKLKARHNTAPVFDFALPSDGAGAAAGAPRTIFCVDMSGSMCVSEGFQKSKWRCSACTLKNELDAVQCAACGQRAKAQDLDPTVYLSRLEAVQHMIREQVEILKKSKEPKSAGLVAFNDAATLVGDGTEEPVMVMGDALHDFDGLLSVGEGIPIFGATVDVAAAKLKARVDRLKAHGQTALGPALLLSIAAAGQVPGSKVILCTDGLSNAGLGALSAESTDLEHEYASAFFTRVTDYAVSKGVYVSVVSIEGEQCNLAELGLLAQRTGGTVHRCRVDELNSCVSEVTSSNVIATHVDVTLVLHTSLEPYRLCQPDPQSTGLNSSVQSVSSVTSRSEVLFQYGPASPERLSHLPVTPSKPFRVPFQVQLRYTSNEGVRRCRVLCDELPGTDDFAHAQEKLNMSVMTAVATEASGLLALGGDMQGATQLAEEYSRWFEARRAAAAGGGGRDEQLYDDYGSVLGMLRGLGSGAPAAAAYDSASVVPSGRQAMQNSVYMTMEPAGTGGLLRQTDEVAENLLHMTQSDRRWRTKPLSECRIVEEVDDFE